MHDTADHPILRIFVVIQVMGIAAAVGQGQTRRVCATRPPDALRVVEGSGGTLRRNTASRSPRLTPTSNVVDELSRWISPFLNLSCLRRASSLSIWAVCSSALSAGAGRRCRREFDSDSPGDGRR